MARPILVPALLASLCLLGCGPLADLMGSNGSNRLAGGGIRTTNGEVAGLVKSADASPAKSVRISLVGVFLSDTGDGVRQAFRSESDSIGHYSFPAVPNGKYALQVTNLATGDMAIMPHLVKEDSDIAVLDVLLSPAIVLQGRVLPPAGVAPGAIKVCLPGLEECVHPGPDSVYTFAAAPQGEYDLVFIQGGTANFMTFQAVRDASDTIYVKDLRFRPANGRAYSYYASDLKRSFHEVPTLYSDANAPAWYRGKRFDDIRYFWLTGQGDLEPWYIEDYMDWGHSLSIPVDKAGLSGAQGYPMMDFPYLVRLGPGFDFTQVRDRGLDLRFASPGGRRLDYFVETWDPAAGKAEIWVRLDSLQAGAPDSMKMFWGKPDAPNQSFPFTPLNREAGYGALSIRQLTRTVWLFDDNAATALVKDQRETYPGRFTRLTSDVEATRDHSVPGIAGRALTLDGISDRITVDAHPSLDYPKFTLCLWARSDSAALTGKRFLVAKGTGGNRQWRLALGPAGNLELSVGTEASASKWIAKSPIASPDAWHFYAATFEEGVVHLYVDGVEAAATPPAVPLKAIPAATAEILVGGGPGTDGGPWRGPVDNLFYDSKAYPSDWVRLMYNSQQPVSP